LRRSAPRAIAAALAFAIATPHAPSHAGASAAAPDDPAPQAASCPAKIPAGVHCYNGRDSVGAPYWIAIPERWNRVLVMHAHGGPEIEAPTIARSAEDLERWAVMVRAGYAWAGSAYRRGGYGVTMAAEDVERLRRLFVHRFGQPRRTILHGQSYGGGVAAKAAEIYGPVPNAPAVYDGVLITSGVLGGGVNAYRFRLDLRVVYQFVCANHPRPDEPQYPLWMGLPADSTLTRAELSGRVKECTGIGTPPSQRTADQNARLATIVAVTHVPERTLVRDLTQTRLGNRNPFDNTNVVYRGSSDDTALNADALRYQANPQAMGALAEDSRPTGRLRLPVLTLHAVHDPTASVELEDVYREIVESAGASRWLVQTFSDEAEHSYLSDPEYLALLGALLDWIERGERPTPRAVADRCARNEATPAAGCRFMPNDRVRPRQSSAKAGP